MSCNGCRVLRKGCSDSCILRPCLQWIESAEGQGHATVFVAKFFGRAGLMGFINAVSENHRPALFQSLLYEACGRTVNPVFGAVGLLASGNWSVCQAAVDTVVRGESLKVATSSTSCPSKSKRKVADVRPPTSSSRPRASALCSMQPPPNPYPCPSCPPFPFISSASPSSSNSFSPVLKKAKLSDISNLHQDCVDGFGPSSTVANLTPTFQDDGYTLVVPVPRRVRPNQRLSSMTVHHQLDDPGHHHDQQQEADMSNSNIELGLALNLGLHVNSRDNTWQEPLVRVGSPSTNSENSVTSFELPVKTPTREQEQQLLHLLL